MRPKTITMQAFGPYAKKTVIDFSHLREGLFLVTGETGSGKTMIFDAIMYALYGESSNASRGASSLRSDFAAPQTETFVDYVFDLRGEEYRILRSPAYMRPKQRGSGMTEQAAFVELYLPDGTTLNKTTDVYERVVELIGLDKDQFRQVVMIAQGAFFDLIEAKSKDRADIYRMLFETSLYDTMENNFAALHSEVKSEQKTHTDRLFLELQHIVFPESEALLKNERDLVVQEANLWKAEPFIQSLQGFEKRLGQTWQETAKKLDEEREQLKVKRQFLEKATEDNRVLKALEDAQKEQANLEMTRPAYEALQRRLQADERATRLVKLPEHEYAQTVKQLEEVRSGNKVLEGQVREAERQKEQALLELSAAENNKEQIEKLPGKITALEKGISDLVRLTSLEQTIGTIQKRIAELEEQKIQLDTKRQEQNAWIEKAEEERSSLEDAQVVFHRHDKRLLEIETQLSKLSEIDLSIEEVRKTKKALEQDKEVIKVMLQTWQGLSKEAHEATEQLFMERAGFLAEILEEGMPCPVCGSTEHPKKAELSEGALSKREVDALEKKANESQQQLDEKSTSIRVSEEGINRTVEQLFIRTRELISFDLSDRDEQDRLATLRHHVEQGKAAFLLTQRKETALVNDARTRLNRRVELTGKIKEAAEALVVLEKQSGELQIELSNHRLEEARLKGEADLLRAGVPGEDEATLRTDLKAFQDLLKTLKERLDDAQKQASDKKEKLTTLRSTLETLLDREQRLTKEASFKKRRFEEALKEALFETEERYRQSVLTEGERAFLTQQEQDERQKRLQNKRDLASLESQAKELTWIDIEIEREAIDAMDSMFLLRDREVTAMEAAFGKAKNDRETIVGIFNEAVAVSERESQLRALSEVARGERKGAEKISFESYIQTCYFARVIGHANLRLSQMSGGRYVLHRTEEASDGRMKTGLDLSVEDMWNAKTRSVSSLSGGEKFQTILSLALGLSDVVTAHAGGVEINSLFIDEGFGSLDENSLQEAMKVLQSLALDDRLIGVISHLDLLRQAIDQKLVTKKTEGGSTVSWF